MTQQQRDHAKQLTYGLLYGMGAAKLADELGCGLEEAKEAQVCGRVWEKGVVEGATGWGNAWRGAGQAGTLALGLWRVNHGCCTARWGHAQNGVAAASARPLAPQERFRRSLPGVEAWQARVVQECKRQGYVEVGRLPACLPASVWRPGAGFFGVPGLLGFEGWWPPPAGSCGAAKMSFLCRLEPLPGRP